MRTFASFLILFGIITLIFVSYLIFQRVNPYRLSFAYLSQNQNNSQLANPPLELIINDLNINLPIKSVQLDGKKWPVSQDAVSYLTSSPVPGQEGNSILYGHNWKNLLGNLKKAKVGQKITVKFTNGSEKVFITNYIQEVTPDQTGILDKSSDTRITLYTCSGFLDSKRFVVVATLMPT